MIIKDTYLDRKIKQAITEEVGRKFNAWERLKLRGIGSQRFDITEASENITSLLSQDSKPDTCNIELRTKGMIVRFQSKSDTCAWTIPYHHLNVYRNGSQLSIYNNVEFIKCVPSHNSALDALFLQKIMNLKAQRLGDVADV